MKLLGFLIVCLSSLVFGCSSKPDNSGTRAKPPALVDTAAFPAQYREAARAVALSVSKTGESPSEFFAEIGSENNGRVLVFHLWHKTAFAPENLNVPGNPGGKCRDVMYDTETLKVTQTLFWQ